MRVLKLTTLVVVALLVAVEPAFAAEGAEGGSDWNGLAAAFAIAIAALGGTLGQARATSAALEGIGRNPGASGAMFTPLILGLVLIESLVIYALVIAFQLVG